MASGSLFGRDDDGTVTPEEAEGVRVLGADEVAEVAERGDTVRRKRDDEKGYGDRPEAPPRDVKPAMRFPLSDTADASDIERPRPAPVPSRPERGGPVVSVGPPTGETNLPHWTAPATGEVPRVVIGDEDQPAEDDAENWQAFASSAPRWRDQTSDWNREEDESIDLVHDDDTRVGALDENDRPTQEEFLTFDDLDLELPEGPPPSVAARGSVDDPIRIQGRRASGAGQTAPPRPARAPAAAGARGGTGPVGPVKPVGSRDGGGRDRGTAVQVGLGIGAVALLLFGLGAGTGPLPQVAWAPMLLVLVIVVAAMGEFQTSIRRGGFHPASWVGLAAGLLLPLLAYNGGSGALMMGFVLAVIATFGWFLVGAGEDRPVPGIVATVAGIAYVALLGSFGALLLRGPGVLGDTAQGISFLVLTALCVVGSDAAGYLIGSRIGRTPLSAHSPNKTREGLLSGALVCVFIALVFGGVFGLGDLGGWHALWFGVVCAVVAPIGDLSESMLKRDLGIKDTSDLLPGHGGVLDRFDAMLFALPAVYYYLRLIGMI